MAAEAKYWLTPAAFEAKLVYDWGLCSYTPREGPHVGHICGVWANRASGEPSHKRRCDAHWAAEKNIRYHNRRRDHQLAVNRSRQMLNEMKLGRQADALYRCLESTFTPSEFTSLDIPRSLIELIYSYAQRPRFAVVIVGPNKPRRDMWGNPLRDQQTGIYSVAIYVRGWVEDEWIPADRAAAPIEARVVKRLAREKPHLVQFKHLKQVTPFITYHIGNPTRRVWYVL